MTQAPLAERDQRLGRVRAAMVRDGLDGLVIGCKGHWWTGRGYMRYLADFHLWGHDGLIIVPREGDPSLVVTSPNVARMIARRGWIENCYGDMMVLPTTRRLIAAAGLADGAIGLVGTRWIIPTDLSAELVKAFPRARFKSADQLLDTVRMSKSPLEIGQNREGWLLAQRSIERFEEVLEPGVPARMLAAEAGRVALAGGARDLLMLVGDRAAEYGPPDDRPLRCDDMVRFHLEMPGDSGHWCEITTTVAFRPLDDEESRLQDCEMRAAEAIRATARPGVRLADLAGLFEQTLLDDGWRLGTPSGHYDFHGQGQDVIEFPWFAQEQPWGGTGDIELVAGTVLSYHPRRDIQHYAGWYPGLSDSLLITDHGAEWLSPAGPQPWKEVTR